MGWNDQFSGDDSSLFGHWASALGFGPGDHSNANAAKALIEKIIGTTDGLKTPDLQPINFQGQTYQGDVTPERVGYNPAAIAQQGRTNLEGISVDPRLKEAQMRALASLQGVADSGGMTSADVANMRRMQSQVAGDDAGRRNAILQNMQARGLGGSGMELLNQLTSSQASTDREAQQGLDIQGMAQQRALQAMMGAGQMGGNMRDQEFGEQARIRAAQDAIDQFNTNWTNTGHTHAADMAYGAQAANADRALRGDIRNADTRQGIANANTDITNKQTTYNSYTMPQQRYDNDRSAIATKQNSYIPGVNYYAGKQSAMNQEQGNKAGSTLGAVGTVVGAIYGGAGGAAAGNKIGQAAGHKDYKNMGGGDDSDYSGYAAHGGVIPGHCSYGGDNRHNDTVPMNLSPGEVVVPRSIAHNPAAAMDFLKHPPSALAPDKQKEAMLSALKNLHKRRGY